MFTPNIYITSQDSNGAQYGVHKFPDGATYMCAKLRPYNDWTVLRKVTENDVATLHKMGINVVADNGKRRK